jgi:uncharacterized membrane protein YraQ (UPF0718 family)
MSDLLKRYRFFILVAAANLLVALLSPAIGWRSFRISLDSLLEMLVIIPPVFILLGLFDVWVPKETVIKLMGERSGIIGVSLGFFLGSFAAGPLYAAFPVAESLMRKGSKLSNTLIFIGAWSTTKIPLLLFEASAMGWPFMLCRLLINIPVVLLIAHAVPVIEARSRRPVG